MKAEVRSDLRLRLGELLTRVAAASDVKPATVELDAILDRVPASQVDEDELKDSLQRTGAVIDELRRQNAALEQANSELQERVTGHEQTIARLQTPPATPSGDQGTGGGDQ